MFERRIQQKLENIRNITAMPIVATQVLAAVDNPSISAAKIANLIEQDQALVARLLRVANSPFYGFARKISTVELAVVVLGTNAIKEILYGLSIKRMFRKIQGLGFDIDSFWNYSLFCASASRVIARKLGYKLAGEAFVAGLMHDIGVLIIVQHFSNDFLKIQQLMKIEKISLIEAEKIVLNTTHSEIGAWLAQKWNLPDRLLLGILNHHIHFSEFLKIEKGNNSLDEPNLGEIDQPLTAIVSIAEWFARSFDFYNWNTEQKKSPLYISTELFEDFDDEIYDPQSSINILRNEIIDEFSKAGIFAEI